MRVSHRFLLLASVAVLIVLASGSASATPALDRDAAAALVRDGLLGGDYGDVRVYVYPETVPAGVTMSTWKKDVFTTKSEGWFFFIDLVPPANWEHPCKYVFVDAATGDIEAYDEMVPPRWQMEMQEITDGRDNPLPGESEKALARFDRILKKLPKPPRQDRGRAFALIISGGASQGNNHIRYWNDCSFIYKALVNYYGYPDENIYVCISDGLDPAPDRSDGTNSPPDLDDDGDDDIQYPATREYIDLVFNELQSILTPADQLFIFTTDHGGQESGWDCYLNLWNWETLRDDELAAYVDALPCETLICTFEQCFSGGMIDDLEADGRVIATAARYDEYSWAMGPDYIYDAFVYFWTCAVGWSDPDGNPVNADTNGDGLISMREAFVYAETHDQESEHPQYSSTPSDLGDALTLFGNLQGVYLAVDDIQVDDDESGASHGDGDGIIEAGETIELTVSLTNIGADDAEDVTASIATTSEYVLMIQGEASYGDIPSGGTVANAEPFVFRVLCDVPDAHDLGLTMTVSEEPGEMPLGLVARAPEYVVGILEVDDSVGGNGDGVIDPGETVDLTLGIENAGGADTPELTAVLVSGSEYFETEDEEHTLGVIPAGGDVVEGGFGLTVDGSCPGVYAGYVYLHLTGPNQYSVMVMLPVCVGQVFADDIEAGGASWTHYAGGQSWTDQWHLETYRNHTAGGTTSWKCGGSGPAPYGNLLYSILETAEFDLPEASRLVFWQWVDAETSQAYHGYCYDGGLLEISTDGGETWTQLTPEGGYPFLIRAGGTPGPFPPETPVWSGRYDWTEVTVDLSGYQGAAKLRWAFGSDGADTREGWYIDDVAIYPQIPSASGEKPDTIRPRLMAAAPSVVQSGAESSVRLWMPKNERVDVGLYDATGRLVQLIYRGFLEAGRTTLSWRPGLAGRMATGRYYIRVESPSGKRCLPLVVLR